MSPKYGPGSEDGSKGSQGTLATRRCQEDELGWGWVSSPGRRDGLPSTWALHGSWRMDRASVEGLVAKTLAKETDSQTPFSRDIWGGVG